MVMERLPDDGAVSGNAWVYRVSDGQLCMGEGSDPTPYLKDKVSYALIDLGESAPTPDPRLQRISNGKLRAATAQEIAAYDAAQQTAQFTAVSVKPDMLAICALTVRAQNPTAWDAMTTPQKMAAARAQAAIWETLRQFVQDNL